MVKINGLLKERRKELNLTMYELSQKVGVSEGTISRWESGDISNMRRDKIVALAKALNVSPSFLMEWDEEKEYTPQHTNQKVYEIPILGKISAGLPLYAEENVEGLTYTDRNGGAEYFALKVGGDSMSAAKINDGDIIIVKVQNVVHNGEIAVVRVNKESATVKRFRQEGSIVHLIPHSFNPIHQVQTYNLNTTKIEVIGKVVECRTEI